MKNLKRLIALVAVFALALTTIASAATFTDVAEDSAYYEAVETLTKLGIIDGMPDGTYAPEQTVTRAEMAKLIATMQGFGATAEAGAVTKFSDVPQNHWASGYIANATGKAIAGYPDGTFGPEQPVKYEQAVKMIMATLGYTVIANGEGGYPMGFVSAAIKADVTDGVTNATVGTDANRGTVAQLIYNAIDTPLVEQITWDLKGDGDYIKYDGETKYGGSPVEYKSLMSEYLGVVKAKAIVLSNSYMESDFDKDDDVTVTVDFTKLYAGSYKYDVDIELLVADTDAADYVGKAVTLFATENDYDDWEILSIAADNTFNKTVTFDIDDFDEKKTDAEEMWYYKNGASKSTKLTLAKDLETSDPDIDDEYADVVYILNGTFVAEEDADDAKELLADAKTYCHSGTVTLIDNDKYNGYDVVIINSAASAVVDEVENGIISLKNDAEGINAAVGEIDTDDDELVVVLTKDGKEITADDVLEGDVVSISYAEDGNILWADVMTNTIEGKISSKKESKTSANGYAYKVDGTYYDVAAGCTIADSVKAGDAGVFYIDKFGKLAYFEKGATARNFAYVANALKITGAAAGIDGDGVEIKLLTKDGIKVYNFADKVTVDGAAAKKAEAFTQAELNAFIGTLVNVTMSGDYVKKIVTAGTLDENGEQIALSAAEEVSGEYVAEDVEIDGKDIAPDATVFFIEQKTALGDDPSTDEVEGATHEYYISDIKSTSYVGTLADLVNTDVVYGTMYTSDEDVEDHDVLVLYNVSSEINSGTGIAVIKEVSEDTNEDDEDIYTLTALFGGEEVTLTTTADIYADYEDELEEGDVVKVRVNGAGVITALNQIADEQYTTKDRGDGANVAVTLGYEGDSDKEVVKAGYASDIKKANKRLTLDGTTWYTLSKFANIYVIDNTGRNISIKVGGTSSFKFDDKLFDSEVLENSEKHIFIGTDDLGSVASAKNAVADYVIIRDYQGDDDVLEMVIIKGADYKHKTVEAE